MDKINHALNKNNTMSVDTTKKTFYYNFFPTKAEEEEEDEYFRKVRRECISYPRPPHLRRRSIVEIRDHTLSPPPGEPVWIRKTLSNTEVESGSIVLSCNETFEHVLRYWLIDMAGDLVQGERVCVDIWDVTKERYPRKYENGVNAYLEMVRDEFVLVCMPLFKNRDLKVYDGILLCWDSNKSIFKFKFSLR